MDLYSLSDQVMALLQQRGRLAYRMLKLQFQLDDEQLEALKEELIDIQEVAVDKDGKMLVRKGAEGTPAAPPSAPSPAQPPTSYTPPHLAERIRAEQAAMEARSVTDGERKTITALFADLKGSTALIEGLDPEEARAIIDPALQLMMDAVHRYEGYVAQALGDGIVLLLHNRYFFPLRYSFPYGPSFIYRWTQVRPLWVAATCGRPARNQGGRICRGHTVWERSIRHTVPGRCS